MGRSARYPTHYRIGVLAGKDVYYNPQEGFAIEREGRLAEMTPKELEAWYCQEEATQIDRHTGSEAGISTGGEGQQYQVGTYGPEPSERPSDVCRNVRLGMEEW